MPRVHTANIFNMQPFFDADELPTDPSTGNPLIQTVLKKEPGQIWRVRAEPLRIGEPDGHLAWALVKDGELVRIPMLPYRTEPKPAHTVLSGMDIIQRYLEMVPNARRTHIVMGDPVQEVDGYFRYWLGFAVQES